VSALVAGEGVDSEAGENAFERRPAGTLDLNRPACGTGFHQGPRTKTTLCLLEREREGESAGEVGEVPGLGLSLLLFEGEVGGADVVGGEGAEEWDGGVVKDGFDFCAAALFAVDEAEDGGDVHAGFAGRLDGGDGGAAGGADIVDDDDASAGAEEALDAAAGAVGLLGFADEEAVDEGGGFGGIFAEILVKVFVGDEGG
jgi:hypothetical protein